MVYVYIRVYSVAKSQVRALRSGYKHQQSNHSSRSFIPKFSLKENLTKKSLEKPTISIKNGESSCQLTTLRIHHGTYQNPSLQSLNRDSQDDNTFSNKTRGKKVRRNNFWKQISQDQKAERFVGIVMGVFVFCWSPYFVYLILSGVFGVRLKDEQNHELTLKTSNARLCNSLDPRLILAQLSSLSSFLLLLLNTTHTQIVIHEKSITIMYAIGGRLA